MGWWHGDGPGGGGGRLRCGDGGNRRFLAGGGGRGGERDGEEGDDEEEEFGPPMKFEEVMREAQMRGASLPSDMLEAAKSMGFCRLVPTRYLDLQGSTWPLGFLMRHFGMLQSRMFGDPSFLFKVGTELVIDSCCAKFAEVQKRGKDFWAEFELYAADLLVGVVVDIALVGMLPPCTRIGKQSTLSGLFRRIKYACGALPSR
ncbi:reticulata-like protein, putative [Actinidia rufa]|uniref:Reticulata-like protein, putative n=1 Tax=Actinidia rufa TaxID=165716 RepID=A0A7J0H433_9ERIC|nr:reticulata-like protein, putative [Actinidia rufa]